MNKEVQFLITKSIGVRHPLQSIFTLEPLVSHKNGKSLADFSVVLLRLKFMLVSEETP
jgi:hypothetical protein